MYREVYSAADPGPVWLLVVDVCERRTCARKHGLDLSIVSQLERLIILYKYAHAARSALQISLAPCPRSIRHSPLGRTRPGSGRSGAATPRRHRRT
eukprot:5866170-Pyramimonas_sp.AAC.1